MEVIFFIQRKVAGRRQNWPAIELDCQGSGAELFQTVQTGAKFFMRESISIGEGSQSSGVFQEGAKIGASKRQFSLQTVGSKLKVGCTQAGFVAKNKPRYGEYDDREQE